MRATILMHHLGTSGLTICRTQRFDFNWQFVQWMACKGKLGFFDLVLLPNFTAMLELWSASTFGAAYSRYQHSKNICWFSSTPLVFSTEMNLWCGHSIFLRASGWQSSWIMIRLAHASLLTSAVTVQHVAINNRYIKMIAKKILFTRSLKVSWHPSFLSQTDQMSEDHWNVTITIHFVHVMYKYAALAHAWPTVFSNMQWWRCEAYER